MYLRFAFLIDYTNGSNHTNKYEEYFNKSYEISEKMEEVCKSLES